MLLHVYSFDPHSGRKAVGFQEHFSYLFRNSPHRKQWLPPFSSPAALQSKCTCEAWTGSWFLSPGLNSLESFPSKEWEQAQRPSSRAWTRRARRTSTRGSFLPASSQGGCVLLSRSSAQCLGSQCKRGAGGGPNLATDNAGIPHLLIRPFHKYFLHCF